MRLKLTYRKVEVQKFSGPPLQGEGLDMGGQRRGWEGKGGRKDIINKIK